MNEPDMLGVAEWLLRRYQPPAFRVWAVISADEIERLALCGIPSEDEEQRMSSVPAWMAPLYRDPNGNLRVVQHADTLTDLEAMAEAQGPSGPLYIMRQTEAGTRYSH